MKSFKSLASAALAIGMVTVSSEAAFADDIKSMGKNIAMLPVRAASVATGMVVGVPVAMMRRSSNRSLEYSGSVADNIGGQKNMHPMGFGAILGVPAGILVGTGEGLYYGGRNAFTNSYEHPFSKASMSLDTELE